MPLARISLLRGKSPAYHAALAEGVYQSLLEAFKVPPGDKFVLVHEHDAAGFFCDRDYLGIHRTDDLVVIQITANAGRTTQMKQALYAGIAERLSKDPGLRREDVAISLVEVSKEDWSFGNGVASYI